MNRRDFLRGLLAAPVGVSAALVAGSGVQADDALLAQMRAALTKHGIRPLDDVRREFGVSREEYARWQVEWKRQDMVWNKDAVMRITTSEWDNGQNPV